MVFQVTALLLVLMLLLKIRSTAAALIRVGKENHGDVVGMAGEDEGGEEGGEAALQDRRAEVGQRRPHLRHRAPSLTAWLLLPPLHLFASLISSDPTLKVFPFNRSCDSGFALKFLFAIDLFSGSLSAHMELQSSKEAHVAHALREGM